MLMAGPKISRVGYEHNGRSDLNAFNILHWCVVQKEKKLKY